MMCYLYVWRILSLFGDWHSLLYRKVSSYMLGQYHCGPSSPHVLPLYLTYFANIEVPDIPRSISQVKFCVMSFVRTPPSPRPCVASHNMVMFIVRIYCTLTQIPVWRITLCWLFIIVLFSIFAATLYIWRLSSPSTTWGRNMLWWKGTHLHKTNYMEFNLVERQL